MESFAGMAHATAGATQQQTGHQVQRQNLRLNFYNQLNWSPEYGFHDTPPSGYVGRFVGGVEIPVDSVMNLGHCISQLPEPQTPTATDAAFTKMVDMDQERALQAYKVKMIQSLGEGGLNKETCGRLHDGGFERLYSLYASRIHVTDYPRHLWHLIPIRTSNPAIIRSSNARDAASDFITDNNPLREGISEEHRADDSEFRFLLANQENPLPWLNKQVMDCLMDEYNLGIEEALNAHKGDSTERCTIKDKKKKVIERAKKEGTWTRTWAVLELQEIERELYPGPGGVLEAKFRACA